MKSALLITLLIGLVLGLGCAHIAATQATFTKTGGALVLEIDRHMDELMNAPDLEENQILVLELHDYRLNERLPVPSPQAQARLEVQRFGPTSYGQKFAGWIRVRQVTDAQIVADLNLVVTAQTSTGNYSQTEKFHGRYKFLRTVPAADDFDGVFSAPPKR